MVNRLNFLEYLIIIEKCFLSNLEFVVVVTIPALCASAFCARDCWVKLCIYRSILVNEYTFFVCIFYGVGNQPKTRTSKRLTCMSIEFVYDSMLNRIEMWRTGGVLWSKKVKWSEGIRNGKHSCLRFDTFWEIYAANKLVLQYYSFNYYNGNSTSIRVCLSHLLWKVCYRKAFRQNYTNKRQNVMLLRTLREMNFNEIKCNIHWSDQREILSKLQMELFCFKFNVLLNETWKIIYNSKQDIKHSMLYVRVISSKTK